MYDVDAIEAINFEQLVTATDRLLLFGRRLPPPRPSTNRRSVRRPEFCDRTLVIQRPVKTINATVVLSSAIITTLLFIAALL